MVFIEKTVSETQSHNLYGLNGCKCYFDTKFVVVVVFFWNKTWNVFMHNMPMLISGLYRVILNDVKNIEGRFQRGGGPHSFSINKEDTFLALVNYPKLSSPCKMISTFLSRRVKANQIKSKPHLANQRTLVEKSVILRLLTGKDVSIKWLHQTSNFSQIK